MVLDKNSIFYRKATKMLEEYLSTGKTIEDLTRKDKEYQYISYAKVYDEQGNLINLETKFELLGFPRKRRHVQNLRETLIAEIKDYLISGGSFHVERKNLPFFERLHTYSKSLKTKGVILTNEQIMKDDLGFREYSDSYYRCKGLDNIKYFRDEEGFVDGYRTNLKFNAYIKDLAETYNIPYYLVITLLADEKLRECQIETDKVKYTQALLEKYAKENGSFVNLQKNNPTVYYALDTLTRYYSDGSESRFTKKEWLEIFDLGHIEHNFGKKRNAQEVNFNAVMEKLKQEYKDQIINPKDLDSKTYHLIIKKAVRLGVSVADVFRMYGLRSNSKVINRLSRVAVNEIPYFDEMKKRRNQILKEILKDKKRTCKEEIFEAKLSAVIQVYQEYKEKLESYYPSGVDLEGDLIEKQL